MLLQWAARLLLRLLRLLAGIRFRQSQFPAYSDGTATARLTGYEKGVTEAGGEFLKDEIQYADAVADKAATSMEAIMQNHPEGVAIIVCNNDDMALGAIEALKAEGYNSGDSRNGGYNRLIHTRFGDIIS